MLAQYLSYEFIALFMFITMLVMMFTGKRVFGAIGFVAAASALLVWGDGSLEMPYTATVGTPNTLNPFMSFKEVTFFLTPLVYFGSIKIFLL